MFLDASVILAALLKEVEGQDFVRAAMQERRLMTSALAMFEAASRICAKQSATFEDAFDVVAAFVAELSAEIAPMDASIGRAAAKCASRYHHLSGHSARLNMGDCFAYAVARSAGLKLAYKGNDFSQTDIDGVRFGP